MNSLTFSAPGPCGCVVVWTASRAGEYGLQTVNQPAPCPTHEEETR